MKKCLCSGCTQEVPEKKHRLCSSRSQEVPGSYPGSTRGEPEHPRTLKKNEKQEIIRRVKSLTPREREIMDRMIAGQANKVIAIELEISQRTVEIHRSRVMHKMGTHSLAHLVRMVLSVKDLID